MALWHLLRLIVLPPARVSFTFSNNTLKTDNEVLIFFKGCLWTLSPAKATKMDEEVLKWSRKDPSAIKRAMAYPGIRLLLFSLM